MVAKDGLEETLDLATYLEAAIQLLEEQVKSKEHTDSKEIIRVQIFMGDYRYKKTSSYTSRMPKNALNNT
ncbi:hypothetical protein ACEQPO_07915 [Bacillus sp. SL00103]